MPRRLSCWRGFIYFIDFRSYPCWVSRCSTPTYELITRQEKWATPDINGSYIKPDYTIRNYDGKVVAYADAKTSDFIPFDDQAKGLIEWSKTTTTKTLIYYTPTGQSKIDQKLLDLAFNEKIRIVQVKAR